MNELKQMTDDLVKMSGSPLQNISTAFTILSLVSDKLKAIADNLYVQAKLAPDSADKSKAIKAYEEFLFDKQEESR